MFSLIKNGKGEYELSLIIPKGKVYQKQCFARL